MKPVLSLFPGIDLLGRAFEEVGFCVVRGPDILFGGDARAFHPPPGVFGGIIGGPPCQPHSNAKEILNTSVAVDLIPEFVRIFHEAGADWAVMENVRGAVGHASVPTDWCHTCISDFECGGETERVRAFWTYPMMLMAPGGRPNGRGSLSVLASTAKKGKSQYAADKRFLPGNLPIADYERLQGYPGATKAMMDAGSSKYFAVHCLGNGVPRAMGLHVASAVKAFYSS